MNENLGLYEALEQKISIILPPITILSQHLPDTSPPYIRIQLDPPETTPLPDKKAQVKATFHVTSRYKGDAEIQALHQKVLTHLEGLVIDLRGSARGIIRFEESQVKHDKDNVTRQAILIFTVFIRFK